MRKGQEARNLLYPVSPKQHVVPIYTGNDRSHTEVQIAVFLVGFIGGRIRKLKYNGFAFSNKYKTNY